MRNIGFTFYQNLKHSSFNYKPTLISYSRLNFFSINSVLFQFVPDKSLLPTLNEKDLEEQFVQGHGPGGQNVNRLQNCVVLRHIPTGIVVKCHQDRLLQRNRKLARQLMLDQLDRHINGNQSISAQKERYILAKKAITEKKNLHLRQMKKAYKDSFLKRCTSIPEDQQDDKNKTIN